VSNVVKYGDVEDDMSERFWVIGGEYRSTHFDELTPGTEKLMGPFASMYDARKAWRSVSMASSASALERYAITSEAWA
jgi:hypothetical protein